MNILTDYFNNTAKYQGIPDGYPPQFTWSDPSNPMTSRMIVQSNNPFMIDSNFVPNSISDFSDLTPNLGRMMGLLTDATITQNRWILDPGNFPPLNFSIAPKEPGDVRVQLEDSNRVINSSLINISGAGSYDTTTGVLHTCLRKPKPVSLFTTSMSSGYVPV